MIVHRSTQGHVRAIYMLRGHLHLRVSALIEALETMFYLTMHTSNVLLVT